MKKIMIAAAAILLVACGTGGELVPTPTPGTDSVQPTAVEPVAEATLLPGNLDQTTQFDDDNQYVINALIPRDGILPIYEPRFVSAEDTRLGDNELVMGVEINGDARAYSVSVLRTREMVNDEIGGTPVLVTW